MNANCPLVFTHQPSRARALAHFLLSVLARNSAPSTAGISLLRLACQAPELLGARPTNRKPFYIRRSPQPSFLIKTVTGLRHVLHTGSPVSSMGIVHEQETNALVTSSDPFPHLPQRDPPPYVYAPLTPSSSHCATPPVTPPPAPAMEAKTVLVPPPDATTPSQTAIRVLDSRDPLSTCDTRFADIILTHIILPRLRVGVLSWKDRETFEFVPQTKEDVSPPRTAHPLFHNLIVLEEGAHSSDKA